MKPSSDYVTECAVGILADLAALYAIKNGGEIDVLSIMDEVFRSHEELGEADWQAGREKIVPMIWQLFTAYVGDERIDIAAVVEGHAARAKTGVQ